MSSFVKRGPCAVCGQQTSNWCSRCQSRFYCSPQHLQQDWPQHRLACMAATAQPSAQYGYSSYQSHPTHNAPPQADPYSQRTTPSPPMAPIASFSALYFSKHEEHPRIVQVSCMPPANPGSSMCPRPIVAPFLPTSGGQQPASIVLKQGLGCQLRYPLHVWYCPGSNTTNRAIWRLTSGQAPRPWKGDVLVMKYSGGRRQGYIDATSLDLPALAQFFMSQR